MATTPTQSLKEQVLKLLPDEKENGIKFADYCQLLLTEKNKDGTTKNPFMAQRTAQQLVNFYNYVKADGLMLDGKHITINQHGVSYDFVAYKNKMLLSYPESKIDFGVVYKGDTFTFSKESGKVTYTHILGNPFEQKESDIIGAYCVIKNDRGEFITTLSALEIQKHRNVAKTDFIWKAWFKEMVIKTVIKKACKQHFDDIYAKIDELDNEQYDLEKAVSEPALDKVGIYIKKVNECKTAKELQALFLGTAKEIREVDEALKAKDSKKGELAMKP